MTLRRKGLVIVGTTFLGLILILYFTSQSILLGNLARIEENSTRQNVERVLSALSSELSILESKANDWSSWDDTYAFIEDVNYAYIQSNLVDTTFTGLKLNLILFINSSGQVVFGKAFDLHNTKEIPVPQSLREHLSSNSPLLTHPDTESRTTGIVLLAGNPMLITAQPILTSEGKGPVRGSLLMGRYLDAAEVEQLARQTLLSLAIQRFTDPKMPADFQIASSSLLAKTSIFVRPLDQESIAGYALVKDIYGRPSLVLRADMPRDIYQQGTASVAYLILSIVGAGVVFGLVTILLLEKQVLSRLSRLSKSVRRIGTAADASERVSIAGTDELASLAGTINNMLEALQKSQQEVKASYVLEMELRKELEAEINNRVEFTRALVHELKSPLTPVLASSELLVSDLAEEPWLSLAKNINRGASRLNDRIDELLDIARGEIGMLKLNPRSVAPLALLRDVAQSAGPMISAQGQTLVVDLPSSLTPLQADEERLRQVLTNLLNNASKFTPREGVITLRARESDSFLTVEVQDTGPGIAKEDQGKLFTPYHRLESDRQRLSGLGLGLALCKTLVELHGGKIWVESEKGKGSVFGFSIPLAGAKSSKDSV